MARSKKFNIKKRRYIRNIKISQYSIKEKEVREFNSQKVLTWIDHSPDLKMKDIYLKKILARLHRRNYLLKSK